MLGSAGPAKLKGDHHGARACHVSFPAEAWAAIRVRRVRDRTRDVHLPVVLTCDCNAAPGSATYAVLRTAGLKDSWLQAQTGEPGFTCCQSPSLLNATSTLQSRIDYVFSRGGGLTAADAQIVGADPGSRSTPSGFWPSDHAGLFAELQQD